MLASQLYTQIHTQYRSEAEELVIVIGFEDFDVAFASELKQLNPDDLDRIAEAVTAEGLAYLDRKLIVTFDRGWSQFVISPDNLVPDQRQSGFDS